MRDVIGPFVKEQITFEKGKMIITVSFTVASNCNRVLESKQRLSLTTVFTLQYIMTLICAPS